uniref:protein-serine/threonine phosphatase n=1 Tax=Mantoniella antarctica TaxID=81844 RepID=A0A7S0T394_9CHLO|mmetsp:Transcript_5765/g.8900  ORF Transcript_5765/g.8900 Transcript_5765/m.8900 type:complete len:354 (+) Transcript_5765:247-1308(+)
MGAYLSQPITDKESSDGEDAKFKYGTTAMQGWRTNMEDAHATVLGLDEDTAFFGVYDGHGGKEVAIYVSRHLHEVFKSNDAYKKGDIPQALIDSFLAMDANMIHISGRDELQELVGKGGEREGGGVNDLSSKMRQAILARARANGDADVEGDGRPWEGPQAGCTCVVAVVRGSTLVVANAGDSRAVLCRRGTAVEMSRDHKPTDEDERARIQKAGGFVQEGRVNGSLALSRAIGDLEYKQSKTLPADEQIVTAYPEIKKEIIAPGDEFMVIACDGIWDVLTSQQCVDFVRKRLKHDVPLSKICEELADECMAPDTKGSGIGCDNMSAVIVLLKGTAFVNGSDGKPTFRERAHF